MKWKYESKYYIIDNALKTLKNNPLETNITLLHCEFIAKALFQVLCIASNVGIMNYSRVFVLYKFSTNTRTFLTCLPLHFRLHPFFIVFFFLYIHKNIFFFQQEKNNKILFLNTSLYFFFGLMVKLSKYICTLESMYEKKYIFFFYKNSWTAWVLLIYNIDFLSNVFIFSYFVLFSFQKM